MGRVRRRGWGGDRDDRRTLQPSHGYLECHSHHGPTDGADRSDTARPVPIKIKPGATLLRDWGGRTWRVEVIADGSFEWDGRRWRSLSAIARAITGTSRNGPAFFGLRGGASHDAA